MPFGFRLRGAGFMLEIFAGISDELMEAFMTNSTNSKEELVDKVLKVGAGGSEVSLSRQYINETYSLVTKTTNSALIAGKLVEIISSATPNLLV